LEFGIWNFPRRGLRGINSDTKKIGHCPTVVIMSQSLIQQGIKRGKMGS
jgi:hypothetical protein